MKFVKNLGGFIAAPALAVLLVTFFYQLWNCDLGTPVFGYGRDSLFHIFVIKTIINYGWFFQNDLVGFPHVDGSFYLYDFPIHSDAFNFLVIKFLALFSSDAFFVTNCFFIFTFALISLTTFVALRAFDVSAWTAVLIALLYSFLPYHLLRNVWHLFLSNYAVVPLSIMVGLWLADGKIKLLGVNEKQQFCLAPNRYFFISLLVSIFAAASGIYYAFYTIIIFVFGWFFLSLRSGIFFERNFFAALMLCMAIIFSLFLLYLPSFIYWFEHGLNPYVANRHQSDSEYHALKIIDLFMPASNHYLQYFQKLRIAFAEAVVGGERAAEGLGLLGSAGFMFLLLWIFAKAQNGEKSFLQRTIKKFSLDSSQQNLVSNLASLNLLSVLFATAGGFVMFIVLPFPLLRSHARFCVFIAFFSLFLIAIIFDKMAREKVIAKFVLVAITVLALLDQVGDIRNSRRELLAKIQNDFVIDREFVAKVENSLPENSQLFVLPAFGFPEVIGDEYESLIFYLHSKKLGWSYPSILGRPSDLWQKEVVCLQAKDFVKELRKAGFSGIVIDRLHFAKIEKKDGWQKLRALEKNLQSLQLKIDAVSSDKRLVFLKI